MANTTTLTAKDIVLTFITALNDENFKTARECLADDMVFEGVMGSRNGADNYIADMQKMKFKYDIKKVFADENEVGLFYNINMGGKVIFSSGWYILVHNKIQNFKVLFDPRPLLPPADKKD